MKAKLKDIDDLEDFEDKEKSGKSKKQKLEDKTLNNNTLKDSASDSVKTNTKNSYKDTMKELALYTALINDADLEIAIAQNLSNNKDPIKLSPMGDVLRWKHRANQIDAIETLEDNIKKGFKNRYQEACKTDEPNGYKKDYLIDRLKREVVSEISMIRSLTKFKISQDKIISKLKLLKYDKVKDELDSNLSYIINHPNDSEEKICTKLKLIGQLKEEYLSLNQDSDSDG